MFIIVLNPWKKVSNFDVCKNPLNAVNNVDNIKNVIYIYKLFIKQLSAEWTINCINCIKNKII